MGTSIIQVSPRIVPLHRLVRADVLQTTNTLLVDSFQDKPSAAAAAGNIVRCALSAAGIAAMEPLMGRMGVGWYFTFLALVGGAVGLAADHIVRAKGMKWRLARGVASAMSAATVTEPSVQVPERDSKEP